MSPAVFDPTTGKLVQLRDQNMNRYATNNFGSVDGFHISTMMLYIYELWQVTVMPTGVFQLTPPEVAAGPYSAYDGGAEGVG